MLLIDELVEEKTRVQKKLNADAGNDLITYFENLHKIFKEYEKESKKKIKVQYPE